MTLKKDRSTKYSCLQFWGSFKYDYKGPYHVYLPETDEEKEHAEKILEAENVLRQSCENHLQKQARKALQQLGESDINRRYNTRKKLFVPSEHAYKRGDRTRGGVDGFRHREGALKKLVPWVDNLKKQGIKCVLLQDGAPAHKSQISRDYLTISQLEWLWWLGHSPEVNASEHAWPWIRNHVTHQFTPSTDREQCERQWIASWDALPIEIINRWVMGIPEVVRRIIRNGGKNNFHG